MDRSDRVAIVVCCHKWIQPLERCLETFLSIAKEPEDLIFVDNGSPEGLGRWARERFQGIRVVRLPWNQLFCGGYNAGIRAAMEHGHEFVLMSNADTEVLNYGFLNTLVSVAKRWPKAAFIGPQVFWKNHEIVQKTCLQFPSILRNSVTWIPWRIAQKYFERQPQEETEVEFLNGVCVLCRISALKEIGLMDENMGGYVEDADWAWRARQKGWLSIFTPVPSIIHYEDSNGYEPYSLKTFLLKRNTVYWYLKAGKRQSARNYARASLLLGRFRLLATTNDGRKQKHMYFLTKLRRTYIGLLRGEPLGEWFGPPSGGWNN